MSKSLKSQPKSPQQSRSKELVKAIYEATVRVLPMVGSKALTTKKIAEVAGVSIGSLYQYFPNKEAVLTAVMDQSIKKTAEDIDQKLDQLPGKSMDESIDFVIDFTLDQFLDQKETIREVFRRAPELDRIPTILQLRQHVVRRLSVEMARFHPGFTNEEYVRVSFIAVNSVLGVLQTMIYDEQQSYNKSDLSYELKLMVRAYFDRRRQEPTIQKKSSVKV